MVISRARGNRVREEKGRGVVEGGIMRTTTLLGVLCVFFAGRAWAADPGTTRQHTFALPDQGGLVLSIPADWVHSAELGVPRQPAVIYLAPEQGKEFSVQVMVVLKLTDAQVRDPEKLLRLRRLAEQRRRELLAAAKEPAVELEEINGPTTAGFAFTITDKEPLPVPYGFTTSALTMTGNLVVQTTAHHRAKDAGPRTQVLEMLRGASQGPNPARPGDGKLRVALPGTAWTIVVPVGEHEVLSDQYFPTSKSKTLSVGQRKSGMVVTVFTAPAEKASADAAAVRDYYWGKAQEQEPMKREGVSLGNVGEFATVEFIVPEHQGRRIDQKNLFLNTVRDGVWIHVRLQQVQYTAPDKAHFEEVGAGSVFERTADTKE
jgi:hypothetical protein